MKLIGSFSSHLIELFGVYLSLDRSYFLSLFSHQTASWDSFEVRLLCNATSAFYWLQLIISTTSQGVVSQLKHGFRDSIRVEELTSRLERSASNEEAINIRLLAQLATVLFIDTTSIKNASLVGDLVANILGQPLSGGLVYLLSLLSGGNFTGANGPNRFVGNDDLAPVADLGLQGGELAAHNLDGLASLTLLERFAAAPNDAKTVLSGVFGLGGNYLVRLGEDGTTLGVAQNGPCDVAIGKLGDRDFSGESTVGSVEDILGSNLKAGAEVLTGEKQVKRRGRDDNL